ncbi:MAG: hypothetical protein AAGN82_25325, partial [Myxococcota bacterium]
MAGEDVPEAAPADGAALVVSLSPEVYGGSSPGAQDLAASNALNQGPSPNVLIREIPATFHTEKIGATFPVAPGPGVVSGTAGAPAWPVHDTSSTVLINGEPCVRNGSCYKMNNGNVDGVMTYDVGGVKVANESTLLPSATNPPIDVTEIERYLADPEGFVPTAPPATARLSPELAASLGVTPAAPPTFDEQWAAARLAQDRALMTHNPPPPPPSGFGYQAAGFVRGVGGGIKDLVVGTAELLFKSDRYVKDRMYGPAFDYVFDGNQWSWLPSGKRGQATAEALGATAEAVWENPGLIWDAMTQEVRDLWAAGEYGEAIGRSSVMVAEMFVGPKGAGRIARLSKMDPEVVAALEKKGVIDADEVAEAEKARHADEAAEVRQGEDGVVIEGDRTPEPEPVIADAYTEEGALAMGLKPAQLSPEMKAVYDNAPVGTSFYGLYDTSTGRVVFAPTDQANAARSAAGQSGHQGVGELFGMPTAMRQHDVLGFSIHKA